MKIKTVYTHIYCLGFILYATAPLSLSLFGVLFVSFSFSLSFFLSFCLSFFLSFVRSFFLSFFPFFLSFFLLSFLPSFLRSFFLSFSLCQRVNRHMLAVTPKFLTQTRISIHSSMDRHLGASNLHAHVHACARSLCTKAAVYQV